MKAILRCIIIQTVVAMEPSDLIGTETYGADVMDPWTTWIDGPRFDMQYIQALDSFRIWAWVPYKTTLAIAWGPPDKNG